MILGFRPFGGLKSAAAAVLLGVMGLWLGLPAVASSPLRGEQGREAVVEIPELSPDQVRDIWARNWRTYASRVMLIGGAYYALPNFEPRFPSSFGRTADQLRRESQRQIRVQDGIMIRTITVPTMSPEEANAAAMSLPSVMSGEYGHVQSLRVQEILGPDEMLIRGIQLIDARELSRVIQHERSLMSRQRMPAADIDARINAMFGHRERLAEVQRDRSFSHPFIVRGFDTRGIQPGSQWTGPREGLQIAVLQGPPTERRGAARNQPGLIMPVIALNRGISEEQFIDMLARADMTVEHFTALMAGYRRDNPDTEHRRVFAEIFRLAEAAAERQALEEEALNDPRAGTRRAGSRSRETPR